MELAKLIPIVMIPQTEVSTEASLYDVLYRKYGLRNVGRLGSPAMAPISEWDMAKHAILHYLPQHEKDYGMADNYSLLNGWNKQTWVYHIQELYQTLGNPRLQLFNFKLAIRAYRKMYPSLKWIRDEKHLTNLKDNPNALIVVNYGLAGRNLRYRPIPMIEVMKWDNLRTTLWKSVNMMAFMTDRQQFIEIEPPLTIPSKMELDRSAVELKRVHMKIFDNDQKLDLLDFWRWMNPATRKQSKLGLVDDSHLSRLNFVYRVAGNFIILNLGKLNEWILGHGVEELEEGHEDDDQDDENSMYLQMQKRFLKFLKLLNEFRKDENAQVVVSDTNKQIEYHLENDIDVDISDDENEESVAETKQELLPEEKSPEVKVDPATQEVTTVEPPIAPADNVIVEKDKETGKVTVKYINPVQRQEIALRKDKLLQQIEATHAENVKLMAKAKDEDVIVQKVLKKDVVDEVEHETQQEEQEEQKPTLSYTELKYTNSIRQQASHLVKTAMMTQGEMRRIEGMATAFKKIKDPYGSGKTLEQVLTEELPVVDEVPERVIPDIPLVTDKTMLRSRSTDFDKRYIKHVMPRDTVRSMVAVQKAGIAVTSYEREDIVDSANEFERHSIQVTPVGGATSTIHIKLPKVREDGSFMSAGTKYVLRKGRRDKPIRKVNDNKVALTSYFGKVFMNRSDKGKYNFDKWLLNQIELSVIDGKIGKPTYGVCSHPDMDLPRELVVLCTRYRSIRLKERGMTIDLEHIRPSDEKLFIIGKDNNGDDIYFDRLTNMVTYGKESAIPIGELLGLDETKRPVDYSEINVLGESIPVGLILARHYGISELCKKLNVQPVKLERGQHVQLSTEQWSLKFGDEIWVFPRENRIASLILGGLKKYESQIKEMPASSFEEKDIYGAILANEGLHVRYEYELDLMEQMFVDDITEHLLEKMNEPTNFPELLIRGSELLLTGYIPTEINMDDMLIKGYERIPGMVYGELVKAMRSHKLKPITSKRRFEIGPNDIWQAIQKDSSLEIRDEINPLANMKEKDNVTFGGAGGRSRRSMTKPTRSYHESDLGTISEATVDNGDVGITTFLSADPNLTDLYGNTKRLDKNDFSSSQLLSSVAMTCPAIASDDQQ